MRLMLKVKNISAVTSNEKPVTLKLMKENLNWKLILDPELEFPEAYMRNEIVIENASLFEFLMNLIKNLGKNEVTFFIVIYQKYINFGDTYLILIYQVKQEKMLNTIMILEEKKGEKLYDIFLDKTHRLYSCAYWKDGTKTLEDAQQNKIDHIVKKLDIRKGQNNFRKGCGWGNGI